VCHVAGFVEPAQFLCPDLATHFSIAEFPVYRQSLDTFNAVFFAGRAFGAALPNCLRRKVTDEEVNTELSSGESCIHQCVDAHCSIHGSASQSVVNGTSGNGIISNNGTTKDAGEQKAPDGTCTEDFLCPLLRNRYNIDDFELYKRSIRYYKESNMGSNIDNIRHSLASDEIWKTKEEKIKSGENEPTDPDRRECNVVSASTSSDSVLEKLEQKLKSIPNIDISDLVERYKYLFSNGNDKNCSTCKSNDKQGQQTLPKSEQVGSSILTHQSSDCELSVTDLQNMLSETNSRINIIKQCLSQRLETPPQVTHYISPRVNATRGQRAPHTPLQPTPCSVSLDWSPLSHSPCTPDVTYRFPENSAQPSRHPSPVTGRRENSARRSQLQSPLVTPGYQKRNVYCHQTADVDGLRYLSESPISRKYSPDPTRSRPCKEKTAMTPDVYSSDTGIVYDYSKIGSQSTRVSSWYNVNNNSLLSPNDSGSPNSGAQESMYCLYPAERNPAYDLSSQTKPEPFSHMINSESFLGDIKTELGVSDLHRLKNLNYNQIDLMLQEIKSEVSGGEQFWHGRKGNSSESLEDGAHTSVSPQSCDQTPLWYNHSETTEHRHQQRFERGSTTEHDRSYYSRIPHHTYDTSTKRYPPIASPDYRRGERSCYSRPRQESRYDALTKRFSDRHIDDRGSIGRSLSREDLPRRDSYTRRSIFCRYSRSPTSGTCRTRHSPLKRRRSSHSGSSERFGGKRTRRRSASRKHRS